MDRRQLALAALALSVVLFNHQRATATVISMTGNSLYDTCTANPPKETEKWLVAATCAGYLTAVMDALAGGGVVNGFRACIPPTADMNQVTDVVKKYIRDHPERR